jgi:hypothetical protein
MAINATIHWGLILRVDTPQVISQEGWKWLLSEARLPFNFDGEVIGLGFRLEEKLREFGFRGSEAGQDADFVDVDHGLKPAEHIVNWLELVSVTPLIEGIKSFEAWKLKRSGVYTVSTLEERILTKGTEVDWPPLIGKIY